MVFKKLLSSLGFGGVEVDTVLSSPAVSPGGPLTGQVHLQAKSEVEIAAIQLLLVVSDGRGELELGRYPVGSHLRLMGGSKQAVPFSVPVPAAAPFNVLYGQQLPGFTIGVRTEVAVTGGSAKTDFDPVRVEATEAQQRVMDALGTIGCRFVRNELRHGSVSGLQVPAVQALTFYAPIPEGQQPGPHVPQLTFNFAGDEAGLTVVAELSQRPGQGDHHRITAADAERLSAMEEGWVQEVDDWVRKVLEQLSRPAAAASGSFLQPTITPPAGQMPPGRGQQQYAYGGRAPHQGYQYGGYRRGGMGSAVAAGVGGAALGFLGGMMIGNMLDGAFSPDVTDAAAGMEDAGGQDYAQDYGGGGEDYGSDLGGDFGGGDWGGGDF